MRIQVLLAALLLAGSLPGGAAKAQTPPSGTALPPVMTPAPVPGVVRPGTLMYGGTPNSMANIVSPPGIGGSFAGPVNSTPYSTSPSGNWPPDAALPDGRGAVQGGAGGVVPNLNQ